MRVCTGSAMILRYLLQFFFGPTDLPQRPHMAVGSIKTRQIFKGGPTHDARINEETDPKLLIRKLRSGRFIHDRH